MRLINTIEINPYDFCDQEYAYPNDTTDNAAEAWDQFWRKCISDKNLGGLTAIIKGLYLVDISTINQDELEEILKRILNKVDPTDVADQVIAIIGGIVLEADNQIYINPSCCGDISNIGEWEAIFNNKPDEWHKLWIGHPWIYYRKHNGMIEFSDYCDLSPEDFKDTKVLVSVSEADLQQEVERVKTQQLSFRDSIRNTLDKMGIEDAGPISQILSGIS